MSKYLKPIQKAFSRNIAAIVFLVFIIFIGSSIALDNQSQVDDAKELVKYTRDTILDIDEKLVAIIDKTGIPEDNPENYDIVIADLNSLYSDLESEVSRIPTGARGRQSVLLVGNLNNFFVYTKNEVVGKYIDLFEQRKDLIDDYESYSELQLTVLNGTVADVLELVDIGIELNNFDEKYLEVVRDPTRNMSIQTRVIEEKAKLESLKEYLESLDGENTLNQEQIDQVGEFYGDAWPISGVPMLKIHIEDVKDQKFTDDINSLQGSVDLIVQEYRITD